MIHGPPSGLTLAAYAALLLAILGLWTRPVVWMTAGGAAIVLGYASGVLTGPAVLWLGATAAACALHSRLKVSGGRPLARAAAALAVAAAAVALGTHVLPGFHNFRVAQDAVLSSGAAPYTLYLNFDKASAGLLILGLLHGTPAMSAQEWLRVARRTAPVTLTTIAVLMAGSLALGYVRFEPGWHALFWIWAPANLFLTCLSEEAFFRGFLQRELRDSLGSRRCAAPVAIAVSAVAFGLAHFAGGASYVLLATVAGVGYALAYARTGRIEAAIATHFAVNATHFLLFTYPRVPA